MIQLRNPVRGLQHGAASNRTSTPVKKRKMESEDGKIVNKLRKSDEKINNEILDEEKLIIIKYIEQLEHKLEIQEDKIINDRSRFEALETKIESLRQRKIIKFK
jgi:hypothetical protein